MKLGLCLGLLALVCTGCAQLPKKVRVEVDDHVVEIDRKDRDDTGGNDDDGR